MKNRIARILNTFGLLSLVIGLSNCYEFTSITQPEQVELDSTFTISVSIEASTHDYIGDSESLYSILLPSEWQPIDSFVYSGTDSGMYRYSSVRSDTMEMQDPAMDGYTWWTFVSDTVYHIYRRNIAVEFTQIIQTGMQSGIYFIDYRLGYTKDANYSIAKDNSNPIWVGIDPYPLEGDIYVSIEDGCDANTGLEEEEPLKSISAALERISADSANHRTIFISGGVYKNNINGERYPLNLPESVSLMGYPGDDVILDADNTAGVICIYNSNQINLSNLTLTGGFAYQGGGLNCCSSNLTLSNVTIRGNSADEGGGIYSDSSILNFSEDYRCNIYLNTTTNAGIGADIFSNTPMAVILDTFTVLQPTEYYATPVNNFSFDILNAVREQVNADLYVATDGNDANDGLTPQSPLKTIKYATSIIFVDSENPRTIYLENGEYSPSTTGESFPVTIADFISIRGESEQGVFLDANATSNVIRVENSEGAIISNLTITGGYIDENSNDGGGGGVCCVNSNPVFENITIIDNVANYRDGGGIFCLNSDPDLKNVTIADNTASYGGGFYCDDSNPNLENVIITGNEASGGSGGGICSEFSSISISKGLVKQNSAGGDGGGISIRSQESNVTLDSVSIIENSAGGDGGGLALSYCRDNIVLVGVLIADNLTNQRGGGVASTYSNPTFQNVTISGNSASEGGGGISSLNESSVTCRNSILWNNSPVEVHFHPNNESNYISFYYCDIQGGQGAIVTSDIGTVRWQAGNINANPLFCNPGDFDYHLGENSPCAGTENSGTDMGAFDVGCALPVGISEDISGLPTIYALNQNFPNPFNPTTTISFDLPQQSSVKLTIFDVRGREIIRLQNGEQPPGRYELQWQGMDQSGIPVSTGVYFCRLEATDYSKTIKMLYLK